MDGNTKTGVYKHTIKVEVLADTADLSRYDLASLATQMDYGDFMGVSECIDVSDDLTLGELEDACGDMGGEATFFGEEMDEGYIE